MSRANIWLLVCLYFIAAMSFTVFEDMVNHPSWKFDNANAVVHMLGGGLVIFIGGGVIPMIGWAIARFQASRAVAPFVLWLLFGCGLAFLDDYGNRFDRNVELQKLTANSVLTGKDRDDMVRSYKLSCVQNQTTNPLTPKLGVSAAKITAYCECMAEGAATAISMDEIKYFVSNGKAAASFIDKTTALGNVCSHQVFAK